MKSATFFFALAMLVIFSACNKDEPTAVNKCSNGFIDPGETGVDCGGNCPPCNNTYPSFLSVIINGQTSPMTTKELHYDQGYWSLQMSNDSMDIQLALGNDGSVGAHPILMSGSYAYYNGVQYQQFAGGTCSIISHNTTDQEMSGFFGAEFLLQTSTNPSVYDTLKLSNGQFEHMPY